MDDNIINILNKLDSVDRSAVVEELTSRELSLQENLKLLKTTNELMRAVNQAKTLKDMYEITQKKLSSVIDTANFIVALLDKDRNRITFPYFVDEKDDLSKIVGETKSIPADQEGSLTVTVLKSGRPTIYTREQIEKLYNKDSKTFLGSIPYIWYGFPLMIKDEIIGVIIIQSYSDSSFFNKKNFKFIEYISSQLAPSFERRLVEDRLKRIEEKYRSLIENSQDLIYQTDTEGKITAISSSVKNLSGYSVDESIGMKMAEEIYLIPSRREIFLKELVEKESIKNFEAELKRKDGSTWWASTNAHLIIDQVGEVIGVEGITRDISERKKSENSLLVSEKKYRDLFEKSQDAILIIENGKFVDCNKATVSMLKYRNKTELLQTHPSQLSPEKQPDGRYSGEKADEMMSIALEVGTNRFEWDHKKADGEVFPVEVLLTPITKEDGVQIIHTVWRDITERKKAEKAIIENQRLGAIGEMSSAVAHDFNNALQSILGYIELSLRNPDLPDKLNDYIGIMKKAAMDAATRVQLLQRFGGKRNRSEYSPLSINTVVSDVIKQSRPVWKDGAEKDGIEIIIDVNYGNISEIFGNEGELRTVLYNIIKNGVESIKEKGIIYIETSMIKENVLITVQDTGIGMDSETASRVFQPLFSSKGFELGRGFGMSGAYSIIKEHDGILRIKETEPGRGTIIEIILPLKKKILKKKKVNKDNSEIRKNIRILWVDDEELIRNVVKEYMVELGLDGDIVESGNKALNYLEKKQYDFVITDIGMPKMNGWQLAKEIRNRYKDHIKVAVITGWGSQVDKKKQVDSGVKYVLGKPITLEQVKLLINEMIAE